MLDWMVWTTPVAMFFAAVVAMLALMTAWELRRPTVPRRGWLPIVTTRGDRLFVGLLTAAWLNLAFVGVSERMVVWFGLDQEPSVWIGFVVSMLVLGLILRKG